VEVLQQIDKSPQNLQQTRLLHEFYAGLFLLSRHHKSLCQFVAAGTLPLKKKPVEYFRRVAAADCL